MIVDDRQHDHKLRSLRVVTGHPILDLDSVVVALTSELTEFYLSTCPFNLILSVSGNAAEGIAISYQ